MQRSITFRLFYLCWLLLITANGDIRAQTTADQSPAFKGLGNHERKITTDSAEAQQIFNQGLAFLYAFNHDEALRLFHRAAEQDPSSASIQWAIALTNGPHINLPMVDEAHAQAAWQALMLAQKHAAKSTEVEQDLITALSARYANPQPEDRRPLDEAYAQEMRKLWQKYPHDADIGALFAESLMDLWPWNLWTKTGEPNADTAEVVKTLETVLQQAPQHPLALHLYVHALEASPTPAKAKQAANVLRKLQPGLGHMVHMPSHIDVRLGHWQKAIKANEKAILADTAYRQLSPEQGFFRFYMAHNHHMLAFAAMMQGQEKRSTVAIQQMLAEMPEEWLEVNAPYADCLFAMPYELHLRFGRWDKMLAEPEPAERFPITRALWHFGRGVAYAAKNEPESARTEQQKFLAARQQIAPEAIFSQNSAADVLAIAEQMLEGEILYREGKIDAAVSALREAVRREDALRYIEPPDWIQPVRHALGATLMDAGKFAEAEAVYREDLQIHPHNGWALHGLAASLRMQGKEKASQKYTQKFEKAWRHADVKLSSSCFCLPGR